MIAGFAAAAGAGEDGPGRGLPPLSRLEWAIVLACPIVLVVLWRRDVIRPASLSHHKARDVSSSPWLIWWFGVLLVLFAYAVGGAAGHVLTGTPISEGKVEPSMASQLGSGIVGAAGALWLMWYIHTLPWGARTGLDPHPRARDFAAGMLGMLAVLPIMGVATLASTLAAYWITGAPPPEVAHETLREMQAAPGSVRTLASIAGATVLAPVAEEVLFRGLLQSGVLRLTGRAWPAIVVTSAAFAAVHIGVAEWHALGALFVLGVCLGVAYERTGRLWIPITMHALFNAANIALALAG